MSGPLVACRRHRVQPVRSAGCAREPAPALSHEWRELADRPQLHRYPFPLRDDLDVSLALPRDLTADEAERLAVFIRTLAQP